MWCLHTYIHIYICMYVHLCKMFVFCGGGVIKLRVCEGLGSIVFGLEGLIIGGYPVWTDDPSQLPFCWWWTVLEGSCPVCEKVGNRGALMIRIGFWAPLYGSKLTRSSLGDGSNWRGRNLIHNMFPTASFNFYLKTLFSTKLCNGWTKENKHSFITVYKV